MKIIDKIKQWGVDMINKATPPHIRLRKQIIQQQVYRTRQDMTSWRYAINEAESLVVPSRLGLVQIYKDVVLDPHIWAVIDNRKKMTLSKRMVMINKDGDIDEEWTKKMNRAGMKKIYNMILDSHYWGYSLVELGSIHDDTFAHPRLFPLEYVQPLKGLIVKHPMLQEGVSYVNKGSRYTPWFMGVGDPEELGLLNNIAPYYIIKKNNMNSWATYSERFGEPVILMKTNVADPDKKNAAKDQLLSAGSGSVSIVDLDEEIQFVEANTGTGYATYKELTEMCDKQVSKLVLGATMIADDGSSFSQSEVHMSVSEDKMKTDIWFLETTTNDQLLPKMRNLGVNIPQGYRLEVENKEEVTGDMLFKQVIELEKVGIEIEEKWITERFNIPIKERKENLYTKETGNGETGNNSEKGGEKPNEESKGSDS
jgi:hypothetical protein